MRTNSTGYVSVSAVFIQAVWGAYETAMRKAELTNVTSLYVASGLLTYGANKGVQAII